jgi:hypothetical protein
MARFKTDPESKIQDRTPAQPETESPGEGSQDQQAAAPPEHQDPGPAASEPSVPARSEANEPAPSAADGEAACPEPREAATDSAPRQAKPKRKYTVSERSKASSRANLGQARKAPFVFTPAREAASMKALEKANAAPPEKRNRFTMLRLLARYANLCLAHLKLGPPGKRGPSHIYSGTSCRHLEHSVALAGEDKAALEAHRQRFQRAFRLRGRKETRLVDGMADAAWRLLRLFGVRSRWEMRAVQFRLLLAIAQRQAGHQMGPEDAVTIVHRLLTDLGNLLGVYEASGPAGVGSWERSRRRIRPRRTGRGGRTRVRTGGGGAGGDLEMMDQEGAFSAETKPSFIDNKGHDGFGFWNKPNFPPGRMRGRGLIPCRGRWWPWCCRCLAATWK